MSYIQLVQVSGGPEHFRLFRYMIWLTLRRGDGAMNGGGSGEIAWLAVELRRAGRRGCQERALHSRSARVQDALGSSRPSP